MTDSLRYWRTRFILIPLDSVSQNNNILNPSNEVLDEEEIRIAGFNKFVELFEKSRWLLPQEYSKIQGDKRQMQLRTRSTLNIQLTTLNTSQYVKEEWTKLNSQGTSTISSNSDSPSIFLRRGSTLPGIHSEMSLEVLSKSASFSTIATAMQNRNYGCPIQDRRWHMRKYENCFVGNECVDWMVSSFTLKDMHYLN